MRSMDCRQAPPRRSLPQGASATVSQPPPWNRRTVQRIRQPPQRRRKSRAWKCRHGQPRRRNCVARAAGKKRPAILECKGEAAEVMYGHSSQRPPQLTASSTLVPSEPITQPDRPPQDAPPLAWAEYHEAMAAWLRWQADVEVWRHHVDARLDQHEQVLRLVPEILERLGPETLSAEHQHTVH